NIAGPGRAVRCASLAECAAAEPDILLIAGHAVFASVYVDSLALLWTNRMGLNAAIIDAASISTTSPVVLRDFIKSLYDLRCAEHFGDGHLGFVVLLGDAYEDDDATTMVIDYDGYGGTSEASDHFYACVSGSDDFEDLMLGRIPVGDVQELASYYVKLRGYTPVPAEDWSHSLLFAAGCFFASKADYVDLFESMAADVPSDYSISKWYRYDYPATTSGDMTACQAMTDSLNKGFLIALYAGDGDKWDWGGSTKRAFRSSYIAGLTNLSHLPIVLSIACSNGWFDNKTQLYGDLGVDCFAERMLVTPAGGAIGCIAASRDVGGGAAKTFAPEIIRSAFANGSSFLGELMLEAKTRHLLNLGSVAYVRQFNLFGDPCLNFVSNQYSISAPDLVIRPYHVRFSSEFPIPTAPLQVSADLWNASGVAISSTAVGLYSGRPDSGGVLLTTARLNNLYPWEKRTVTFDVPHSTSGNHEISLVADPYNSLSEADETNNTVVESVYVYPCQDGFPLKVADNVKGQVIADLDDDGDPEILVISGGSMAQAIDLDGHTIWVRKDLGQTLSYPGLEPAAADLNGDGTIECVIPIKSGVVVVDGATGATRWQKYTDYSCLSPMITDLDGDGSFEVVTGTFSAGGLSKLVAFDASGTALWTYSVPGSGSRLTGLVACDADLDGKKDLVYSTSTGTVACLACNTVPPTVAWTRVLSTQAVTSLVAGDLERDGRIEIVAGHDTTITILNAVGGAVKNQIRVSPCQWSLSLGDVDGDQNLEIICSSSCGEIGEIDGGVMTLDLPIQATPHGAPVLADLDSDNQSEIIFGEEEGLLRIIKLDGTNVISPMPLKGPCLATPVACNIDGDPAVEVVAGSVDSVLFVVDLASQGKGVEWSCDGGSPMRTSLHAQPLFGDLSGDMCLNGRIDVVGDVNVASGKTLTFERGSDVHLVTDQVSQTGYAPGQCEITVNGALIVRGTRSERVSFAPAAYLPVKNSWQGITLVPGSSGSFTQAAFSGAVAVIDCQTSDAHVSECAFDNSSMGVKTVSASPLIDSNTFTADDYGISASGGSPTIVNNTVTANIYAGITISSSCSATLESNTVSGVSQGSGLAVYSSSPAVGRNNKLEYNSQAGIYLSNSSPTIDSCWVAYNGDCGIKAAYYSNPVVAHTSIVGNKYGVGVYMNSNPVLGDTLAGLGGTNDIRQNTFQVFNRTSIKIKAQHNWWGGTPGPSMFVGQVDYSGWLPTSPAGVNPGTVDGQLVDALYPNPFSRSVRMSLNLSSGDLPVTVEIFDCRGRLVRKLLSGGSAGRVSLVWDGTDEFGSRAASGAYFVTAASRTRSQTSKVVLLK
ncbi:MAG TPA: C25 family cysteine peptidase, partial [bacterium]|nr:C25 family cysteine peptidase [bacterium]